MDVKTAMAGEELECVADGCLATIIGADEDGDIRSKIDNNILQPSKVADSKLPQMHRSLPPDLCSPESNITCSNSYLCSAL